MTDYEELVKWGKENSIDTDFICNVGEEYIDIDGLEHVVRSSHQWIKVFKEPQCKYFEVEELERNDNGMGTCNKYGGKLCPYSGVVKKEHTGY